MKRALLLSAMIASLNAATFSELFDALKQHSQTKLDIANIKEVKASKDVLDSKLYYPKLDIFAKYDYSSHPAALYPVTPKDSAKYMQDKNAPQRFSENILTEGVNAKFLLFLKSLDTLSKKLDILKKSAEEKKRVNLIKNEASIVIANSNLIYLNSLKEALKAKEKSLLETEKIIKIKVENGRFPESALYKIQSSLNEINIAKNSIDIQKENLKDVIRKLTGITLKKPIELKDFPYVEFSGEIGSLKPLELQVKATHYDLKAKKEELYYPKVTAYAAQSYFQAKAYNNDKELYEDFTKAGIMVDFPIFDRTNSKEIEKAKVDIMKYQTKLQKLRDELGSKAMKLKNFIPLLDKSIELSKKDIKNRIKLLEIAKVSYKEERMTTEEFLRYEDAVVDAKAKLFSAVAKKWETLMQLAVIYAKNIEEIVK